MNILLLSQLFSSTRGGGEYVFSLLAKKLGENGHRVFVITNRIKDEEYKLENVEIVFVPPVIEYKGGIPPKALENLRYSINVVIVGLKIIKREKIDIIHSNNFAPALAGSVLTGLTGKPHIITIHDVLSLCGKNYWKIWGSQHGVSKSNLYIASILDKLITKLRHDCIHTVSETTKEDLIEFGEKKPIHVIHNSVEDICMDHGIQANPFQFVYVGRLLFSKNLEIVIRAVGIARNKEPRIKIIIIGDGPHRKTLEKITRGLGLESNIEFKGHLSESEKIKTIQSSCALVFPSVCEGFGIVILESFACKRPVLVSNVKPMSDTIIHEKTGFVIEPYDAPSWAEHFLKIIHDDRKTKDMGKNGSELLITKYNQEIMYQGIMKMYNSVLSKN